MIMTTTHKFPLQLFVSMRGTVFTADDESLAQLVAGVTVHVLKPAMEMETVWSKTELKQALKNVLDRLYKSCVPAVEDPDEMDVEDDSCPLAAPAFAYSFPVIRAAMKAFIHEPDTLTEALELISEHTALRGNEGEEDTFDMFSPRYLPRAQGWKLFGC